MENPVYITCNTFKASKRHKSLPVVIPKKIRHKSLRIGLKARTKARSKIQKRSYSVSTKKRKAKTPPVEVPPQPQGPGTEKTKQDLSRDRVDKVLEQLVSSLSRVEDRVSSVEEHMKNTRSSIEARVKDIEQQLEKLEKISLENASAPGFSCRKSDDHDHDHFTCKNQSNVVESDDLESGENVACSQPGFVITAPEFSDTDEVASPGSNCVVDKCETLNHFPLNHINGGSSDTKKPQNYAKSSRIFSCFFCSGL